MTKTNNDRVYGCIAEEFLLTDFGDKRISNRLAKIAVSLSAKPTLSFPQAFGLNAEIEGGYRLLRNKKVTFSKILNSHIKQTAQRAREHKVVLALHDTTEMQFSTKREGLGFLTGSKSAGDGFYCHFSLAVEPEFFRPLGVIAADYSIKKKTKGYQSPAKRRNDPTRKTLCWGKGIRSVEANLGANTKVVHIADREADFFELLTELNENASKFVIRVCRNREVVNNENDTKKKLYDALKGLEIKLEREIVITTRRKKPLPKSNLDHPPRKSRTAKLVVTAEHVELKRGHHHPVSISESVSLNIVHVSESSPPENEAPIDWKLYTTESIETAEDIAKIVDMYRARWLIEEYFKALKSGCSLEQRQLESSHTILNAVAIFAPIAWQMLLLRSEARCRPNSPAEIVLTKTQIQVLVAIFKSQIPKNPNVQQALAAIAQLGGHLKQNGPPGWKILTHGFTELLTIERGWQARERCDQ